MCVSNFLQRYNKYLKFPNFQTQKLNFSAKNGIHSCVCQFFFVILQPICMRLCKRACICEEKCVCIYKVKKDKNN